MSVSDTCISHDVILEFPLLCSAMEGICKNIMVPGLAAVGLTRVLIDRGFCQSPVFTVPEHMEGRIKMSLTSLVYL